MPNTHKKVICWKCDTQFEVEVETTQNTKVTTILGDQKTTQELVARKYIVKCPNCTAENEVRL